MREQLMKLPPQNLEFEESLLSYCLIYNPVEILDDLNPDDFYKTAHKLIFDAIGSLHRSNHPVQIPTVVDYLRDSGNLEKCGGAVYISQLTDAPVPSNARYYAKTVKSKSLLRRGIEAANQITEMCFKNGAVSDDVIDRAQKIIMGLSKDSGDVVQHIGETIIDVIEDLETRTPGENTGISSGIKKLDMLLGGFQNADSILLGARPSMGKTAFALNLVRNIAMDGIPCAVFSLEMSKKQNTRRLLAMESRVDSGRFLQNFFVSEDWARITDASARLSDLGIYVDDRSGLHYRQIRSTLRRLKQEKGIGFAVIDYLQLVTGDKDNGRYGEIGSISREIKAMAKEFDIPVMALCQLNRKLEERADRRPRLADLRDSGELEQDADVVIFLYRDEVYDTRDDNPLRGIAEVIVAKHREGAVGAFDMAFLKNYQRFEPLATNQE